MQRLNTITNNSSPYSDDGWVDPDETDAWAGLKNIGKKLLNFGGRKEEVRFRTVLRGLGRPTTDCAARTVLRGLCCADCAELCWKKYHSSPCLRLGKHRALLTTTTHNNNTPPL